MFEEEGDEPKEVSATHGPAIEESIVSISYDTVTMLIAINERLEKRRGKCMFRDKERR